MMSTACGVIVFCGIYKILHHAPLQRLFGIMILSLGVNLSLMVCGRINAKVPAILQTNQALDYANPLGQALILTAIVIGFGICTVFAILIRYQRAKNAPQRGEIS